MILVDENHVTLYSDHELDPNFSKVIPQKQPLLRISIKSIFFCLVLARVEGVDTVNWLMKYGNLLQYHLPEVLESSGKKILKNDHHSPFIRWSK